MSLSTKNTRGLTLTELIVASILMAIVMLGVTAVDISLRSSYQTVSKDTDVAMRVAAAMLHITKYATVATGMRNNPGFMSIAVAGPPNITITAIRHDVSDPSSYDDDLWVYYSYNATTKDVTFCPESPDGGVTCTKPAYILINAETFSALFIHDETEHTLYLDITVSSLYDNTAGYELLDNPRTTLRSRILPLQHTW